ncbi:MAG: TSUP family transporter, partial [Verrucomicrobia bacterium]|nr:TSUP family transporter [Verrucomicrobiota bacterium]
MDDRWYFALFATGLVAGYVDAIAGGGGLITVPVLLATGLSPAEALGTNKFQSSWGTALATARYARHGLLKGGDWIPGIVATLVGAAGGAWSVQRVNPDLLRPAVPILLAVIALTFLLKPDLGASVRPARMAFRPFAIGSGLLLGFYDGFFGPGTGSFWMMACVLVMGRDLLGATAHTKVMNLTSNLASLVVFLAAGQVRFTLGLTMAAGQVAGREQQRRGGQREAAARLARGDTGQALALVAQPVLELVVGYVEAFQELASLGQCPRDPGGVVFQIGGQAGEGDVFAVGGQPISLGAEGAADLHQRLAQRAAGLFGAAVRPEPAFQPAPGAAAFGNTGQQGENRACLGRPRRAVSPRGITEFRGSDQLQPHSFRRGLRGGMLAGGLSGFQL